MPPPVVVLINAGAGAHRGAAGAPEQVMRAFAAHGIDAEVRAVEGRKLTQTAWTLVAAGVRVVVAAGGDGTISAVAHALVGRSCALGVLPMGTLNHFALDLGVPPDLDGAVSVIAAGRTRAIDVGEVNGRFFINNSSIGLYPTIIADRERQRSDLGRRKYLAMAVAAWRACRRLPLVRVRIAVRRRRLSRLVPFVFIGNNRYRLHGSPLGRRERLDGGRLWLYVPIAPRRSGLVRLMLLALFRRLERAKELREMPVAEAALTLRQGLVEVGLDGELVRMRSPLRFRIHPRSLVVVAPGGTP
jgi:diacylglycerol kinase family enzyme